MANPTSRFGFNLPSMDDPASILTSITDNLAKVEASGALSSEVETEANTRAAENGELGGALTDEIERATDAEAALQAAVDGKAQKSHASSSTTYGAADTTNYGHMRFATDAEIAAGAATTKAVTPKQLATVAEAEADTRANAVIALSNSIATEATAREDGDEALEAGLQGVIKKLPAAANCQTAAGTAAKTVAITGFVLFTGAVIAVRFANGNSATNPTLNAESSGDKPIHRGQTYETVLPHEIQAGSEHLLVYDGTAWVMMSQGIKYAASTSCSTAAATAAKTGTATGVPVISGLMLTVTFTNKNTATNPTFNLNGNGAKSIVDASGANVTANVVPLMAVLSLTTSGKWLLINPPSGPTRQILTVPVSAWTGNTATIAVPGVTADMPEASYSVRGAGGAAQKWAEAAAGLGDTDIITGDGTITITAVGVIPTVPLVIAVTIYGGAA
jgi:hypothetical protein